MAIFDYIELLLSYLLSPFHTHDARLFTASPAFTPHPTPRIPLSSPTSGPSNSLLHPNYTQLGSDLFPTLTWPPPSPSTKEYILICEDADMPLPGPIAQKMFHGLYYAIPARTVGVEAGDFEIVGRRKDGKGGDVKGGWKYTKNIRGVAYAGPRPVLGHGPHRYFYQLVALKEPLDLGKWGGAPSKAQLAKEIEGKVVGWGVWVGVFERKWSER